MILLKAAKVLKGVLINRYLSKDNGFIEINGTLNGVILRGGHVLIAPSGRLCGSIEARSVEISGVVQGDVEAESLVVQSTGQLYHGKLECQHLSIEDGCTIVNKHKQNSEKFNVVAIERHSAKSSNLEYMLKGKVENPVKARPSVEVPIFDNSNDQQNANDIWPLDYLEVMLPQEETHTHFLKENKQKQQGVCKQPHFTSSY